MYQLVEYSLRYSLFTIILEEYGAECYISLCTCCAKHLTLIRQLLYNLDNLAWQLLHNSIHSVEYLTQECVAIGVAKDCTHILQRQLRTIGKRHTKLTLPLWVTQREHRLTLHNALTHSRSNIYRVHCVVLCKIRHGHLTNCCTPLLGILTHKGREHLVVEGFHTRATDFKVCIFQRGVILHLHHLHCHLLAYDISQRLAFKFRH